MKRFLPLLFLLLAPVVFLSAEKAENEGTAAPEEKSDALDLSVAAGAAGSVSASFRLTDRGIDLFALEISGSYLSESVWGFGLGASIGGGYEFDFQSFGSLALWAEIGVSLYEEPAVDEISLSVAYEVRFGLFYLNLEIAPSVVPAEEAEFSCEATLAFGLYL